MLFDGRSAIIRLKPLYLLASSASISANSLGLCLLCNSTHKTELTYMGYIRVFEEKEKLIIIQKLCYSHLGACVCHSHTGMCSTICVLVGS